jgi:hypothetical protein
VRERTTSIGRVAANIKSSLGGQRSDDDIADTISRIPGAAKRYRAVALMLGSTPNAALSRIDGLLGGLSALEEGCPVHVLPRRRPGCRRATLEGKRNLAAPPMATMSDVNHSVDDRYHSWPVYPARCSPSEIART